MNFLIALFVCLINWSSVVYEPLITRSCCLYWHYSLFIFCFVCCLPTRKDPCKNPLLLCTSFTTICFEIPSYSRSSLLCLQTVMLYYFWCCLPYENDNWELIVMHILSFIENFHIISVDSIMISFNTFWRLQKSTTF